MAPHRHRRNAPLLGMVAAALRSGCCCSASRSTTRRSSSAISPSPRRSLACFWPPRCRARRRYAVLAVQAFALGLMTRPETMQPARATAMAAAALVGDGVVLLPRGNDGVGIVGAFAVESPSTMRLLVVGATRRPRRSRAGAGYPRVVLGCWVRTPRAVRRCPSCAALRGALLALGYEGRTCSLSTGSAGGMACSSRASR